MWGAKVRMHNEDMMQEKNDGEDGERKRGMRKGRVDRMGNKRGDEIKRKMRMRKEGMDKSWKERKSNDEI